MKLLKLMYGSASFGILYSQTEPVIAQRASIKNFQEAYTMKKLQDIMTKDCITVTKQDNIYEIAVKMKEHDIGFIPIVDGKKLIGVVTDRDLVLRG